MLMSECSQAEKLLASTWCELFPGNGRKHERFPLSVSPAWCPGAKAVSSVGFFLGSPQMYAATVVTRENRCPPTRNRNFRRISSRTYRKSPPTSRVCAKSLIA